VINAGHPDVGAMEVLETVPLLLDNRVLQQMGAEAT
jgi:hypothetical protein